MNKIIVLISAVFMLLFTSGCQDWLDVNHDPNVLEEIPDAKVLLPAAEVGPRHIRLPNLNFYVNTMKLLLVPHIKV